MEKTRKCELKKANKYKLEKTIIFLIRQGKIEIRRRIRLIAIHFNILTGRLRLTDYLALVSLI